MIPSHLRPAHIASISVVAFAACAVGLADEELDYTVKLTTVTSGWGGKKCWVHSRAGAIPARSPGNPSSMPIVVMTTQKLRITGSDIFDGLHDFRTDDLGAKWTGPVAHTSLDRRPMGDGIEAAPCDFTPQWHARTGKLLGTGKTFWYKNDEHFRGPPSDAVYSVYDPGQRSWSDWARVDLPDLPQFKNCSAGCAQRYDLPNGDVLLPVYFRPTSTDVRARVTVVRCKFDGKVLEYAEHGDELEIPDKDEGHRGFSEPSLTRFKDRFYLTLRADHRAYVANSKDGLSYDPPKRWRFDDGEELGSYNTQQHWVTHSDGLYLTYTRRGADNDHVFRHRAPIFMARVDPEHLVVIRDTERIIIPETGTRMGNFGIVEVSTAESWVITTEWMQPRRPDLWKKYGTDNRIFCVRIKWSKPNRLASVEPDPKETIAALRDLGAKLRFGDRGRVLEVNLQETDTADQDLATFKHFKHVKDFSLPRTKVTSMGLENLSHLTRLEKLYLTDTQIDDRGLVHLSKLRNLKILGLSGTAVSDAGLEHLKTLKALDLLFLIGTKVSDQGVEKLKSSLPSCDICN